MRTIKELDFTRKIQFVWRGKKRNQNSHVRHKLLNQKSDLANNQKNSAVSRRECSTNHLIDRFHALVHYYFWDLKIDWLGTFLLLVYKTRFFLLLAKCIRFSNHHNTACISIIQWMVTALFFSTLTIHVIAVSLPFKAGDRILLL